VIPPRPPSTSLRAHNRSSAFDMEVRFDEVGSLPNAARMSLGRIQSRRSSRTARILRCSCDS